MIRGFSRSVMDPNRRSHADLERRPRPRHRQTRPGSQQRCQQQIRAEVPYSVRIGVEPERLPNPLDDMDQPLPIRQVRDHQQVLGTAGTDLQHPRVAIQHDDAPIAVFCGVDRLDARDVPGVELRQRRVPVVGRVEAQPDRQAAIGGTDIRLAVFGPGAGRRAL